ncbi:MAG: hypothetical protein AB3N16_13055 [Flavobacteriaceae bacterium]
MTKKMTLLMLMAMGLQLATAQYKITDGTELLPLKKVPLEKMYVHLSSNLLFSGEYMYYKLYVINAQTHKASAISSVGYIDLVNAQGQIIFNHKVRLEKGVAQGDFFLNTDVPSGHYKLVAYTQWMKNGGLAQVFQEDVLIINPYLADQSSILANGENGRTEGGQSQDGATAGNTAKKSEALAIETDTSQYGTRSKVTLGFTLWDKKVGTGKYSLSVRKKGDIPYPTTTTAESFSRDFFNAKKSIPQTIGDSVYLPEQRGELIHGQVTQDGTQLPAANKQVVISIPDQEFILKSVTTNDQGYFYAYLKKDYNVPNAIFQVMGEGQYTIRLLRPSHLPYEKLHFDKIAIDTTHGNPIRARSLQNQIENAFFEAKPDSILPKGSFDPFDGGMPKVYVLDDYTRFPTFQETLVEIFENVGYRNNGKKGDYIRVAQDFEKINESYNDFPAIVLIDGVFIPDHERIKELDARNINKIYVLQDQLVLGPKQYQGMVFVETFKKDYMDTYQGRNVLTTEIAVPKVQKRYFKQHYPPAVATYDRIPDYRHLLLWEPHLDLSGDAPTLAFFTSDVKGTFEVVLEGFTDYGKPISLKKTFVVK